MKKVIFIIIGVLGILFFVGQVGIYLLSSQPQKISRLISQNTNGSSVQFEEFVTQDKVLKVIYSKNWIELPKRSYDTLLRNKESSKNSSFEVVLSAQKFELNGEYANLVIQKVSDYSQTITELMEEMRKFNAQQGWQMEITKEMLKDTEGVLEVNYTGLNGRAIHSKEKIILLKPEHKVYIIAVLSPSQYWGRFSREADQILDSIKLIDAQE